MIYNTLYIVIFLFLYLYRYLYIIFYNFCNYISKYIYSLNIYIYIYISLSLSLNIYIYAIVKYFLVRFMYLVINPAPIIINTYFCSITSFSKFVRVWLRVWIFSHLNLWLQNGARWLQESN